MSSIQLVLAVKRQLANLDQMHQECVEAFDALKRLITPEEPGKSEFEKAKESKLFEDSTRFYSLFTAFSRNLLPGVELPQQPPPQQGETGTPPPSQQGETGAPPQPLTARSVAFVGIAFTALLVASIKQLIPIELMAGFAFLTAILAGLPNLRSLLERKRGREEALTLKPSLEWVNQRLEEISRRYEIDYNEIRYFRSLVEEGVEEPEELSNFKAQAVLRFRSECLPILSQIMAFTNKSVWELKMALLAQLSGRSVPTPLEGGTK